MRNNQPVTQTELKPPEDQTLISVTDLKGRITYANKAFISMSGYLEEELMGQPHNIIRHPDMPEEAFRDLWATVEAGIPWTGIVKNRRKNGDYYWVRANATPMRDGDRIVGYLSVRTPATEDEKKACTALYATMQQEARNGRLVHILDKGRVYRAGLLSKLMRIGHTQACAANCCGWLCWPQRARLWRRPWRCRFGPLAWSGLFRRFWQASLPGPSLARHSKLWWTTPSAWRLAT
jgi:PAS domain S-box-containing protein